MHIQSGSPLTRLPRPRQEPAGSVCRLHRRSDDVGRGAVNDTGKKAVDQTTRGAAYDIDDRRGSARKTHANSVRRSDGSVEWARGGQTELEWASGVGRPDWSGARPSTSER